MDDLARSVLATRGRHNEILIYLLESIPTLIAAHALGLGLGLSLVTNNTQHFRHVRGLKAENWV